MRHETLINSAVAEKGANLKPRARGAWRSFHGVITGILLFQLIFFAATPGRAQTDATPQATAAPSPSPPRRIVSKDPDYLKLVTAPLADDYVRTHSQGYRDKSTEIDAKVAEITDEKSRAQARADEWDKVSKNDQNRFRYEADVALNDARTAFAKKHRDALLDLGLASYDESQKSLVLRASPTAPLDLNFRMPISAETLNQIYDRFHQIVGQDVERQAHEYVAKSGADSPCARIGDLCFKLKRDDLEQNARSQRIVVVAQGDLEQNKIDRYLLVDYITETLLLEFDPHISRLSSFAWRFAIGPVPAPVIEPEPVVAPVQATAPPPAEPAPVAEPPAAAGATTASAPATAAPGNATAPAVTAPSAAENPPARVKIPDDVIAASIISKVKPVYPAKARAANIHGDVVLHATIDTEGKISNIQVLSGEESLAKAAVEAVRQWRYKPILWEGQPTEVDTIITIAFSMLD
jgi:TonB family protein